MMAVFRLHEQEDPQRRAVELAHVSSILLALQTIFDRAFPADMPERLVRTLPQRLSADIGTLRPSISQLHIATGALANDVALYEIGYSITGERIVGAAHEVTEDTLRILTRTTDSITRREMRKWYAKGGIEVLDLRRALMDVGFGRGRAEVIATTEVTKGFARLSEKVYIESGVVRGKEWQTANDERVCPICAPLGGLIWSDGLDEARPASIEDQKRRSQEATLGGKFYHPGGFGKAARHGGQGYECPAHARCRCRILPVLL